MSDSETDTEQDEETFPITRTVSWLKTLDFDVIKHNEQTGEDRAVVEMRVSVTDLVGEVDRLRGLLDHRGVKVNLHNDADNEDDYDDMMPELEGSYTPRPGSIPDARIFLINVDDGVLFPLEGVELKVTTDG
jgi:hypothetical protein